MNTDNPFKNSIINGHDIDGWIIYNQQCETLEEIEQYIKKAWNEEGVVRISIEIFKDDQTFCDKIDNIVESDEISDQDIAFLTSWIEGLNRKEQSKK